MQLLQISFLSSIQNISKTDCNLFANRIDKFCQELYFYSSYVYIVVPSKNSTFNGIMPFYKDCIHNHYEETLYIK